MTALLETGYQLRPFRTIPEFSWKVTRENYAHFGPGPAVEHFLPVPEYISL